MTVCDNVIFQSVFTVSKISHSDAAKLPIIRSYTGEKTNEPAIAFGLVPLDNLVLEIAV